MNAVVQTLKSRVPAPDKAEIGRALAALFEPADVIELRAFHKGRKRTDAGYFDAEHRDKLAAEAVRLSTTGAAVYVTLNPLDPQLLSRYANRIEQFAQATATDANVIRRRWLLLDFDPVRPKDTSATEEQLKAAKDCARKCYRWLNTEGWPEPLAALSGNGMHLLYALDLPNDRESTELVKGALAGLAQRFANDVVTVDQAVFNAGRILKLYGVVSNKGDHTEPAPWRVARLVSNRVRGQVVTADQLRVLQPETRTAQQAPSQYSAPLNLEDFLSRQGIDYSQDTHDGRERYKLDHCPFNATHAKGEAAILRAADGKLGFKCQHASCADKHWQDVRTLIDGPCEARTTHTATAKPQTKDQAKPHGRLSYRCAADIHAKPFHWLWQGRIARGKVSMLAGNPGLGKSQSTASMAAIVTTGGAWPVDRTRCERGNVVILSAEDDPADTIRPRLEAAGADLSRVLILDGVVRHADGSGRAISLKSDLDSLGSTLADIGDVALVVIDPITAYLGDTDSHKNAEIRALLAPLSDLAATHGAAIVCVSHLNKSAASDAMLRVQGSLAFVAAARAAFLICKDQENEARRLFLPMKNNIGNDQTGLAFSMQGAQIDSPAGLIETSRVMWDADAVTVTADQAMNSQGNSEERGALDEAAEFLREVLRDDAVSSKQVRTEAEEAGYSWRTINRARKTLKIEVTKAGMKGPWQWRLCAKNAKEYEECQTKNVAFFGNVGILRERDPPKVWTKASYEIIPNPPDARPWREQYPPNSTTLDDVMVFDVVSQ